MSIKIPIKNKTKNVKNKMSNNNEMFEMSID